MIKQFHRRRGIAAAAFAAALAISALTAGSASAVLTRLPNGQVASYQPLHNARVQPIRFDNAFGNLDYNGGAVMPSNTDYIVFWSPKGMTAYPPDYAPGLETYFTDLSHDSGGNRNTDSVSTQYNDLTGAFSKYAVTFGGPILDTDPYPASQCPVNRPVIECLTDTQIQAELQKVAAAHHIPHDFTHELFLMTPPHVEGCFSNDATANPPFGGCSAGEVPQSLALFCAYHQETATSPMRFYADDPFVTGNPGCDDGNHPNHSTSDGALQGGLSHEHNESITDPIPNDAWTNGSGPNHGLENGDQCDGQMGPVLGRHDGAKYNQVINGHFYWYQEEWSNQTHSCLQRFTLPATLPTATFAVTARGGTSMTFNAAGSTAPGGVADYSWQFNAVNGASTVEETTPSITHNFPAAGDYSIGLAVFASDGLSIGTGGIIRTGQSGFAPGFTFSPAHPAVDHAVTFTGLSTVSRKPVTNDLWEFGDGTTGVGRTPTHTYKRAGTYQVEVIQFSGIGSAFPGDGAAPVSTMQVTVG